LTRSPASAAAQPPDVAKAPFEVRYLDDRGARPLLSQSGSVLGVIGYGAARPDYLASTCPFVAAPLSPAAEGAMFEIWMADTPVLPCRHGRVVGAASDSLAFGAITIEDDGTASFEDTVEAAYRQIFDFLESTGIRVPIRFWNYLTAITEDDRGLERYMRFNTGRHRAFSARLRQAVPPAASGVGGYHGASVIYCLAAREAALPVENPRQISAYSYPPIYGPTSPSFSRASIHASGATTALFISGTASIVGHETRHRGDLRGQIAETIENLRALIEAAGQSAPSAGEDHWALKIYLRDAADRAAVDAAAVAMFGADSQRLYLRGDICRSALLVEIEAFRHA
jgi:chorismate lyase / 3-hydroxybenzoate synthase